VAVSRAEMATFLLQLSAQPNKNLEFYVGKNVGMWAKMWALFGHLSKQNRRSQ
jgi:hypothetical protein